VAEALHAPGVVVELFATADASQRNRALLAGRDVSEISPRMAQALSGTVTPQGLIAVCRLEQPTLADVLAARPRLLVTLIDAGEPGNLGAIIRTADAAGADAVVLDGGADPYNGKSVRASAGSLFHLPVVTVDSGETGALLAATAAAGLISLAATGHGDTDLELLSADQTLARPTVWLFGSEAHGLPAAVLDAADHQVRVPIYGSAESLNLAVAAGICIYASAREQRKSRGPA
jgi:RNA methyltransferase, TrmH family